MGVGEKLVEKLRNTNSTMGYLTISLALYKIATPLRYTVTLGQYISNFLTHFFPLFQVQIDLHKHTRTLFYLVESI